MKKNMYWMAVLTIFFVGCKDTAEVRSAVGTYSYKASVTLQVDTLPSIAYVEQGTLEIVSLKDKDSVMLSFSELLGGVYCTHASIDGDELELCPFTRSLGYVMWLDPITIQVSGSGHVYDDNVVLDLEYQNMPEDSLRISAPDVLLIAKKIK